MEHLINVTASKAARGGVAEFMGYCEVEEHEASRSLTPGLWLVRACACARVLGEGPSSGPRLAPACAAGLTCAPRCQLPARSSRGLQLSARAGQSACAAPQLAPAAHGRPGGWVC
jgi:hypothetical protein